MSLSLRPTEASSSTGLGANRSEHRRYHGDRPGLLAAAQLSGD
jgi:hypothetical protein